MATKSYFLPSQKREIEVDHLDGLDSDEQEEIINHWFSQNFEHPDDRTPYDSEEEGYIWIWGGPFDAREEIHSEFLGLINEDILERVITELECESTVWGPAESPDDYDDEYINDLANISDFLIQFNFSMAANESLTKIDLPVHLQQTQFQLLYANSITALGTYLSTAFINNVVNNENFKQKFIESTPEFKEEKFQFSDIYVAYNSIDSKIHKYLSEILWHNLAKVKLMYKATFDIQFPDDLKLLYKAVSIRHDIVHRNGRAKDGQTHTITLDQLSKLNVSIKSLISTIETQLPRPTA